MIEHVPLSVDFLQGTVGVVGRVGGGEGAAVLIGHYAAGVHQNAAGAPGTQGRVSVGIAQGRIGRFQTVVRAAVAGEHHYVLVAHLADAGGLKTVAISVVAANNEGDCFEMNGKNWRRS